MTATSKEQGMRILACGISASTADMTMSSSGGYITMDWNEVNDTTLKICVRNLSENEASDYRPAWSLSRLLEILPTPIFYQNRRQAVMKISRAHDGKSWFVSYDFKPENVTTNGATLTEAAVRMIEYINNKQNRTILKITE